MTSLLDKNPRYQAHLAAVADLEARQQARAEAGQRASVAWGEAQRAWQDRRDRAVGEGRWFDEPPPPEPVDFGTGLLENERERLRAEGQELLAEIRPEVEAQAAQEVRRIVKEAARFVGGLEKLAGEASRVIADVGRVRSAAGDRRGLPPADVAELVEAARGIRSLLEPPVQPSTSMIQPAADYQVVPDPDRPDLVHIQTREPETVLGLSPKGAFYGSRF